MRVFDFSFAPLGKFLCKHCIYDSPVRSNVLPACLPKALLARSYLLSSIQHLRHVGFYRERVHTREVKMDSVVGRHVLIQVEGGLQPAVVRAASQPASLNSDFSKTEVLLEWEEAEGRREWAHLKDSTKYQAMYVESKLLWAKRVVTMEQQRRAVAWPSKAFTLLCSNLPHYPETMIVEYFCDRERSQLYLQDTLQETKELQLSQAKGTLIRHPLMLMELEEWEEAQNDHALLTSGQTSLVGRKVTVCNVQTPWPRWIVGVVTAHNHQTRELTVQEDGPMKKSHTVNPLTVHVLLRQQAPADTPMRRSSSHNLQIPPRLTNPNLLLDGSEVPSLLSPHLPSPSIQESSSPVFPGNLNSVCPITAYRTPSIDLHRRSSLHVSDSSLMHSEPNLFRRSSLDPLAIQRIGGAFSFNQEASHPGPVVHSPTHIMQPPSHTSPHSSNTHINRVGSNSRLNEQGLPPLSPRAYLQQERSKSMENLNHSIQLPNTQAFKRRMSAQVPLAAALPTKRPRFDLIPSIGDMNDLSESSLPSSLHRSMSMSAISSGNRHSLYHGGRGHSTSDHHDDELDMIKEIIDRDDMLGSPSHHHHHHHSLTNIPAELSISLPALHPPDGLQVLSTYNSAPAIANSSSFSSQKTSPTSPTNLLSESASLNGTAGDFSSCNPVPGHKDSTGFVPDSAVFPAASSSSLDHSPLYGYTHPPNSTHIHPPDSAHLHPPDSAHSTPEQKPSVFNFNMREMSLTSHPPSSHTPPLHPPSSHHAPHSSIHIPHLTDMLRTEPPPPSSSALMSVLTSPTHLAPPDRHPEPAHIAKEAEVLHPGKPCAPMEGRGVEGERGEPGELDISVIVNQHASHSEEDMMLSAVFDQGGDRGGKEGGGRGGGGKEGKMKQMKPKAPLMAREGKGGGQVMKRGRGRPRLTEEEKQRRKELRDLGLMKRSHRRSKEEVAQWRAERILSPAKRGRKPGSGKKNVVKAVTGKEVYVSMDLSKFGPDSVLLQNGFCRAFPGIPKCLECSTSDGDLPLNRYCRFLEFRKIHIVSCTEPLLQVEGFANYMDVQAADLVPWTPLKVGYSGMDPEAALFTLRQVAPHFVDVVTTEARTLPEGEVTPVWKRAVQGLREMCDTCDTTLFNFHWVCPQCGFCICPSCYHAPWEAEEDCEMSGSLKVPWPPCVSTSQPHTPSSLIVAQIIPANVLADVVSQMLKICEAHHIWQPVPRSLQQLISLVSRQTPQSRFQNERKGKSSRTRPSKANLDSSNTESSFPSSLPSSRHSSPHESSPVDITHFYSNGRDEPFPITIPHLWLCEGTVLYLLDPSLEENMSAFQHQWRKGLPVLVAGVEKRLTPELWTPQAFGRDFGDELSDLVDCRGGLLLPQCPSHMFWNGFEDMSRRPHDPATGEPRLLKLKDWPPGDDFSEKLPKRFANLIAALPLQHYTKRDGKLNMASSLPSFFAKPDMGPKMYNAYGSPAYPSCGTTNLHLDISDAVNVMVYCSIPVGAPEEERRMVREIVRKECCPKTCQRLDSTGVQVGALWHIYAASDTDKIRAFLRMVFEERGLCQPAGTDPIHDQLVYLDSDLRQRLLQEYGVKGWAIAQGVGDAIFIPAGAPHQVRNLCSCIKVAEDFVSPEHVHECLKLTEEFRQLSDRHVNHEDKLQVKNIMYHSIKDIVGILKSTIK